MMHGPMQGARLHQGKIIHIDGPSIYRFEGWLFEIPRGYGTPWPIKENGTPYKRAGRVFWDMIKRFESMGEDEQNIYYQGGGSSTILM